MDEIYSGSVVIRTDNFSEITPQNAAFIVEYIGIKGDATMLKLKGISNQIFCLDNFQKSKKHKTDLKRAYDFLIDLHKKEIKKLRDECKHLTTNSKKDLFTTKDLKDSGIIL